MTGLLSAFLFFERFDVIVPFFLTLMTWNKKQQGKGEMLIEEEA